MRCTKSWEVRGSVRAGPAVELSSGRQHAQTRPGTPAQPTHTRPPSPPSCAGDDEASRRLAQAAEGVASLFADPAREAEVDALFAKVRWPWRGGWPAACLLHRRRLCSVGCHARRGRQPTRPAASRASPPAGQAAGPQLCSSHQGEHRRQRTLCGALRASGVRVVAWLEMTGAADDARIHLYLSVPPSSSLYLFILKFPTVCNACTARCGAGSATAAHHSGRLLEPPAGLR